MYYHRGMYPIRGGDQRFIGFGLPFVGGLVGGLLGSALFYPRPYFGYPRPYFGPPPVYGYPYYGPPYY